MLPAIKAIVLPQDVHGGVPQRFANSKEDCQINGVAERQDAMERARRQVEEMEASTLLHLDTNSATKLGRGTPTLHLRVDAGRVTFSCNNQV